MPHLKAHMAVDADLQTIWRVLLDKIENPKRYLLGVDEVSFPESTEEYAVREMTMQGQTLKERITIDERQGEVHFELLDHPFYAGKVINALIPPAEDDPKAKPVVQFRMDWEPLNDEAQLLDQQAAGPMQESLEDAVRYVKEMAEKLQADPGFPKD